MLTTLKKYPRLVAALTVAVALTVAPALLWPELSPKVNGAISNAGACYALAAVIFLLIVPAMWWYDSEMLKYPGKKLTWRWATKEEKDCHEEKNLPVKLR